MFQYLKTLLTFYTTTRLVKIKSPFLAVVYIMVVTFMWLTFLLGWLHLDIKKVYQRSCPVMGVVSAKVKGFASTENISNDELGISIPNADLYRRPWDFTDLVSPPFGGEGQFTGFTVATNFVITANQTRGTCAEVDSVLKEKKIQHPVKLMMTVVKRKEIGRAADMVYLRGNVRQGTVSVRLVDGVQLKMIQKVNCRCERALLEDVKNFTVLIKNSVGFPGCGDHKGQNIPFNDDENYLKNCIHDRKHQPRCPIFRRGDIVEWSNANFSDVAKLGGVFRVEIKWICDFDFGRTIDDCEPKYSFSRVDDKKFRPSKGWNFRYADYHEENRRTLHKVFGLQILVSAAGEGRKFEFFEAIISLGAMVGLFAVASLLCDFLFDVLCLLNSFHCTAMKHYTQDIRFGEESTASSVRKISPTSDSNMETMSNSKQDKGVSLLALNSNPNSEVEACPGLLQHHEEGVVE